MAEGFFESICVWGVIGFGQRTLALVRVEKSER